jgi:osmotically inducible lipoprotein OsmB
MKHLTKIGQISLVAAVLLTLGGCAGMSTRDRNTITGAGVGAVAGAILTGGSSLGTIGGGVVGGVIGDRIGNGKK